MNRIARIAISVAAAALAFTAGLRGAAAVGNLNNHGGPTMQTARVFLIFWLPSGTSFDTTVMGGVGNFESLPAAFVNDLSATSYLNIITQYPGQCGTNQCVLANRTGAVSLGGSFVDTRAYPHAGTRADPLQDSDIQGEVTHAVSVNGWTAGTDAEFFVFTGAGIEECQGSNNCTFNKFCAYHGSFSSSGTTVLYGYLSDASFNSAGCSEGLATGVNGQLASDREVALMSHEFFETITDPVSGSSAWWDSADGNEIGDNCNQQPATVALNGHSYDVQQEWSNDTASCVSSFGPSVQLAITTGDDDLRGDSSATASLERADFSSIETVTVKAQGAASFDNNTGHIVVAGYSGGATELADLALTLTSHNGFIETDDNWNVNGLVVRLLTATGGAICEQDLSGNPLTRLTGSVPTATFATPSCSPAPPMATFDTIFFNVVTGGDDLRGDSSATATVNIAGQAPQVLTLKSQSDASWDNNSTHTRMFTLASAQQLSAFVNVTVTLTSHNGFIETDDNWNIQTINVTLSSSGGGGTACLFSGAGNPFVRLTGSGPSVTLNAGSGC
jgi:hypothetical protein